MTNISTLPELRSEIRRLRAVQLSQEAVIDQDVNNINEMLKPENLISNAISSFTVPKATQQSLLKGGVNSTVDFLIDKVLFRNSSFIVRAAASMIAKKFSGQLVDQNAEGIMGKIHNVINNLKHKFMPGSNPDGGTAYYQSPPRQVYNNEY